MQFAGRAWWACQAHTHAHSISPPQKPSFHFFALLCHHTNTPNPPNSSCFPIFWVGKSLWNKTKHLTVWGGSVSMQHWEWQSLGSSREWDPGRWGWLWGHWDHTPQSPYCLCRWPIGASQCFPQTSLSLGSGKKAEREQLFCGCQEWAPETIPEDSGLKDNPHWG